MKPRTLEKLEENRDLSAVRSFIETAIKYPDQAETLLAALFVREVREVERLKRELEASL